MGLNKCCQTFYVKYLIYSLKSVFYILLQWPAHLRLLQYNIIIIVFSSEKWTEWTLIELKKKFEKSGVKFDVIDRRPQFVYNILLYTFVGKQNFSYFTCKSSVPINSDKSSIIYTTPSCSVWHTFVMRFGINNNAIYYVLQGLNT